MLPQWLQIAHTPEHIRTAYVTLAKRERTRQAARSASIQKHNTSKSYRTTHSSTASIEEDPEVEHYSVAIATHPDNSTRNRYTGVEPYDRTRVVVGCGDNCEPSGRYLNASWVRELFGGKWWIAQQAPLPSTVHAFLSLILQPTSHPPAELHPRTKPLKTSESSRVRTVVQLTKTIENGLRKAHTYFPSEIGQSLVYKPEGGFIAPSYKITLVATKQIEEAHCLQSTLSIQPIGSNNESVGDTVSFNHLFFPDWPDHGVPEEEHRVGLLHFLHLVDRVNRDISTQPTETRAGLDPDPPIIVNCSAGIGRTGSFVALSSLLRDAGILHSVASTLHDSSAAFPALTPSLLGPLPDEFREDKVVHEIDALREQRPGMVQKSEQVELIYDTLVLAYKTDRKISDTASVRSLK